MNSKNVVFWAGLMAGALATQAVSPGSGSPVQLTHFNTPGFPESTDLQSGIWPTAWSPDGTQRIVAQQPLGDLFKGKQSPNKSWLITIHGAL